MSKVKNPDIITFGPVIATAMITGLMFLTNTAHIESIYHLLALTSMTWVIVGSVVVSAYDAGRKNKV